MTDDLLATWCLSPRYRTASAALRTLTRDDGARVALSEEEWAAVEGPTHPLPCLSEAVRGLIARKVLVPAYLVAPPEGPTLLDYYLGAWTAVCMQLGHPGVASALRQALADWSGTVLRQPLGAPGAYFPLRPSFTCSLAGSPGQFQLRCDCRDPLLLAGENLAYARAWLGARLGPAQGLFERLCTLLFAGVEPFSRQDIKYLYAELDLDEAGSAGATLFWNLGALPPGERLQRMAQALEAVESAPVQPLARSLLAALDAELLGVCLSGPGEGGFRLARIRRGVDFEQARPLAQRLGAEAGLEQVARVLPGLEALGFDRRSTFLALVLHRPAAGGPLAVEWHLHLLATPVPLRLDQVSEVVRGLPGAQVDVFPEQLETPAGPMRVAPRWLRLKTDGAVEMVVAFRPGEARPSR